MIIDFHVHTFPEKISTRVIKQMAGKSHINYYTNGSIPDLISSMKQAGINYSVNLPVMTRPNQVEKINNSMIANRENLLKLGIIPFGGIHPDYADYKKELRRLKEYHIPGIKLHPAYQDADLDDIRMMRIIDCASEEGLITLVHAGIDLGIYDRNYSSVPHILKVLDEVHPERFVLAHMGNWGCWDEMEKYLAGAPVWMDTAFSIGPFERILEPGEPFCEGENMPEEDLIRVIRKHGIDRILFATDSPWSDQTEYVNRLNNLPFSEEERKMIFSENALQLLALEL